MSGRRCKALKAKFEKQTGAMPHQGTRTRRGYEPSQWRRLKKGYSALRRKGEV